MNQQRIIVLLGSESDLPFAKRVGKFLDTEKIDIRYEYQVSSAHRTPDILLEKLKEHKSLNDNIVYITVAGLSDALSGFVAGFSHYPVIACPPDLERWGMTKAFSSSMTPRGVPVFLCTKPENSALGAAKILALSNPSVRKAVQIYIQRKREETIRANSKVGND